jgi:hypothetical protein
MAWHGEKPFPYTWLNVTIHALPWRKDLLDLRQIAEKEKVETFNSCLLNLYHSV